MTQPSIAGLPLPLALVLLLGPRRAPCQGVYAIGALGRRTEARPWACVAASLAGIIPEPGGVRGGPRAGALQSAREWWSALAQWLQRMRVVAVRLEPPQSSVAPFL